MLFREQILPQVQLQRESLQPLLPKGEREQALDPILKRRRRLKRADPRAYLRPRPVPLARLPAAALPVPAYPLQSSISVIFV